MTNPDNIRDYNKLIHLLGKLKVDKSPGSDEIHYRVLFELREHITEPLIHIFNSSFHSGHLPTIWKEAKLNVTPIFKKGRKSDPNNYRPVSLTSAVCKIMETIIRYEIILYLEDNNLFSIEQHGFRSGRSCTTQLMETVHDWTESLDKKNPVDAAYLDYGKAFDRVPHERLLVKLHAYGIRGKLLDWIRSFLSHRKQRVIINGV